MLMNGIAIVIAKMVLETNNYTYSKSGHMSNGQTERIHSYIKILCCGKVTFELLVFISPQTIRYVSLQIEMKYRETLNINIIRCELFTFTTQGTAKRNWHSKRLSCNVFADMRVQMNILNRVHATLLTVVPY